MRLIDPIRLKQALAVSAILEDKKTIEQIIDEQPTIEPERVDDPDRIYTELSKVYNMDAMPDEAKAIIGDLMISLPDAPERKKGRWIDETFKPWGLVYHPYKCDQCGEHSESDSDFCPNCGARMEGEG